MIYLAQGRIFFTASKPFSAYRSRLRRNGIRPPRYKRWKHRRVSERPHFPAPMLARIEHH